MLALATTGCASVAPLDNPLTVRPLAENPAIIAPGIPDTNNYAELWEQVIDVLDDYFELKPTSRYAGYIETLPRIAPGYEQPWMPGSPDKRERLIATFQTIRNTAKVTLSAGDRGGYKVYVEVWRELIEIPKPARVLSGAAIFQEQPDGDRRFDVIPADGNTTATYGWIPEGRDYAFEQVLLRKIREKSCCSKSSQIKMPLINSP
jgi:hypothetical protein